MNPGVETALISGGSALFSAGLVVLSNAWLQARRTRRESSGSRDGALVELLAAAVGFALAMELVRTSWVEGPSMWDRYMRPARLTAMEMSQILSPSLDRLLMAATSVSIWKGSKHRPLVEQSQKLGDAAGDLSGVVTGKRGEFDAKMTEFQDALRELRHLVDARP